MLFDKKIKKNLIIIFNIHLVRLITVQMLEKTSYLHHNIYQYKSISAKFNIIVRVIDYRVFIWLSLLRYIPIKVLLLLPDLFLIFYMVCHYFSLYCDDKPI